MPAFILMLIMMMAHAQAHTTGQKHVHLSCPGDEHCAVVPSGGDQPTSQTDKPKTTSDKEH